MKIVSDSFEMSFGLPPQRCRRKREMVGFGPTASTKKRRTIKSLLFFSCPRTATRGRRFCHKTTVRHTSPAPITYPAVTTRRINAIISREVSAFPSCFGWALIAHLRYLPRYVLRTHVSYVFRQKKTAPRMVRHY